MANTFSISPDGSKIVMSVLGTTLSGQNSQYPGCTNNANNNGGSWRNCAVIMDMNGNVQTILGNDNTTINFVNPVWSPDGTKIAVVSNGIVVMNADGSNPVQILSGATHDDIFIDWTD